MRLLLDSCVWGGARAELAGLGHDVEWTGAWERDPGDDEILQAAVRERRVLVTLDKDFGELAVVRGAQHCGIVRLVDIAAREQGPFCAWLLARYETDLQQGALVTADARRVRIRPRDPA